MAGYFFLLPMLNLVIHFPSHRLTLKVTKRRVLRGEKTLISELKEISDIRRGSRISRFFRVLMEQKRVKTLVGGNLTMLAIVATAINPQNAVLSAIQPTEPQVLSAKGIELTTQASVRMPLNKTIITQYFSVFHPGIDLDGVTGDSVYPIMKGAVESVLYEKFDYGNHIIINHGSGIKSLYAHLSKIEVAIGEEVTTDKEIGKVGATGRVFGDHLHLEIREDGRAINPLTVLPIK
ncbi:hypothetical protein COT44_03225 [Candidatus Shapirobacteria bacterium CG08_land_8_20_14_0_20_39_18]|uniref:M23ase beta-sheet core domain-containing protein n=1 Tax=Candidatus Shapirobacteria bacterium CG08_land_8_20_14_0_20_39_18 TaxID=1974883 RepID=A0A2M6XCN8_9BACT|nr:MAG: hypothetical protein COT44_03225 [Candidatus Shapirobacteria bacterium CG08_land_8_20_14_0_20_39_18]PIY65071.1 MAG: hypothetical protein COY91_03335 [Candidatus Shapirobacteria bacterium CG_4_10_14_0_8_um_filter_39_15]